MSTPKDAPYKLRQAEIRRRNKLSAYPHTGESVLHKPVNFSLPLKGAKELARGE